MTDETNRHEFIVFKNSTNVEGVEIVEPREVYISRKKVCVIDVRTRDEFNGELGHIEGSIHVPLDTIPEGLEDISLEDTLVFVCRTGQRSFRAAELAHDFGFKREYNMAGGMMAWNALGFKTEKEG